MIFKFGYVHCDAHPGNMFVRRKNNRLGHDIVLLDHGIYRTISPSTIKEISCLWISLMIQDKQKVLNHAEKLNIHSHFEYLPIIFLYRSRGSVKKIGADFSD